MLISSVRSRPNWEHTPEDAHVLVAARGLAAVFDGLAGHGGGAFASRIAAVTTELASREAGPLDPGALLDRARSALNAARAVSEHPEMTCTAVVAVLDEPDGRAHVAWCGDSRAYRLGLNGRLVRLTEDHDLLYDELLHDRIMPGKYAYVRAALDQADSKSEAWRLGGGLAKKLLSKRNIMVSDLASGAVGVTSVPVAVGETLILTSDGIHDNLPHSQLQAFAAGASHAQVASVLVAAAEARARAGEGLAHADDITCVALTVA